MSTSKAEGEEEISITLEHIPRHVRHIEIDLSEDNDDATATTADQPKVGSKRSSEFERHELELESLDHPSHGQKKQKKEVEVEAHQTPNTILELREHTVHVHHPHRPPLDLRGTTTEKTKDERATEKVSTQALETGHIYFFYRPKVELSSATDDDEDSSRPSGLEDVQRFYLLLVPFDAVSPPSGTSPAKKKARLLVIGRKVLPGPRSGSDRKTTNNHWGYVDDVGDLDEIVKEKLSPQQYETVTRGVRTLAGARPCGMGVYTIAKHRKSGYTHLAYVNELPSDGGEVQEVFNIRKEESFIFSVKNPLAAGFGPTSQPSASSSSAAHEAHLRGQPNRRLPGTMTSNDGLVSGGPPAVIQKPVLERYPEHLQKLFGPRRFLAVDPVELLDFKGAEFVLHAVSYSVANDLGTELGTDLETLEREELGQKPLKEAVREKLYQQLHLSRAANPPNAILTGHWV